jgi:hypothetical protein
VLTKQKLTLVNLQTAKEEMRSSRLNGINVLRQGIGRKDILYADNRVVVEELISSVVTI